MNSRKSLRSSITAMGSFVSLPEAFEEKVEMRTARFEDSRHPLKLEPVMFPHTLLIDFEAVDADAFDAAKIVRDCELLKSALEKHPEELKGLLEAFAANAPHERMLDAAKTVERLELSEKDFVSKGGGLIMLVVLAAVMLASSCKGCAHVKGALRQ